MGTMTLSERAKGWLATAAAIGVVLFLLAFDMTRQDLRFARQRIAALEAQAETQRADADKAFKREMEMHANFLNVVGHCDAVTQALNAVARGPR